MNCDQKFFICKHCGNIVGRIISGGVPMMCCGEKMEELVPNTVEAAVEKHIPVVRVDGNSIHVEVGSTMHPMTEEHLIQWVYLQTTKGGQRKCIGAGDEPKTSFVVTDDEPIAVFAYCNLHGLWKKEI